MMAPVGRLGPALDRRERFWSTPWPASPCSAGRRDRTAAWRLHRGPLLLALDFLIDVDRSARYPWRLRFIVDPEDEAERLISRMVLAGIRLTSIALGLLGRQARSCRRASSPRWWRRLVSMTLYVIPCSEAASPVLAVRPARFAVVRRQHHQRLHVRLGVGALPLLLLFIQVGSGLTRPLGSSPSAWRRAMGVEAPGRAWSACWLPPTWSSTPSRFALPARLRASRARRRCS